MITVTADEIQSNFAKYLQAVREGDEILIMIDGRSVAKLCKKDEEEPAAESFSGEAKSGSEEKIYAPITESLTGILKGDYDYKEMRDERYEKMREKYESLG